MKVSIITPSFNQGQYIEQTILSVLNQSYRDIEYIIIDGGSTDNTMKVIGNYAGRIDKVIHETDKGQADAINKGLKLATGSLVGWINSDDIIYPDCVAEIVKLANAKPDGVIYHSSKVDFIDEAGKKLKKVEYKIDNKEFLLNKGYDVVQQGSFYRSDAVKKVQFLDPHIRYCMDLDLWLKLLDEGNIYYYDKKPLAAYRLWNDSKTVKEELRFIKDIENILKQHGMKSFSANHNKLMISKTRKAIKKLLFAS